MPVPDVLYPVNLDLVAKRCVVVGGGSVAARKAASLIAAGADVVVIAPQVCDEIKSLGVEVDLRPYRHGDLGVAWLAIAATDDPETNQLIQAEGRDARVWVNAADDPEACSFTLPAVLRRGPVLVAVSTSGRSPALAAWLREQVARQLGPEVGALAEMLSEARDELK